MPSIKSIQLVTNVAFEESAEIFGLRRYQTEIYTHVKRILPPDLALETTVLRPWSGTGVAPLDSLLSGFVRYPLKIREAARKSDLLHILTHHFAYLLLGVRHENTMVTCFDMIPFARKEEQTPMERGLNILILKGMKKARRIIAISHWTKGEIMKYAGVAEEKIFVVPCAVDHSLYFPDKEGGKKFREAMDIPDSLPIFLYVGSEQPRKNLKTLTSALRLLAEKGMDFLFLKVGRPQWPKGREIFLRQIHEARLEERTKILDYVPENAAGGGFCLREVYNAADIFLFPSLYEGFGIPILEAMACGVPTVVSNTTSLPEVAGDGAILLPPEEMDAWSDALRSLLDSEGKRKEAREKGIVNAKKFQWSQSADILKNLYAK